MSTNTSIRSSLAKLGQDFEVLPQIIDANLIDMAKTCHVRLQNVARSVLLTDRNNALLLAITPASHCIDLTTLSRQLHRELQLAQPAAIELLFPGYDPENLPPFSTKTVLPCIIDDNLAGQEQIYFPAETRQLIRMSADDFHTMLDHALHGFNFSYPMPGHQDTIDKKQDLIILPAILEQRLTALDALPSIPDTTRQLLRLLNNEHTKLNELAHIIDHDPMLSAQLLKQARSSLYGYGGTIETVQKAILQVFGYETALHMAIGMSAAKSFKGCKEGKLGQKAIYHNAVLVSALCEALAKKMPVSKRPAKGSAQLTGLLHNLGYLLLAHLFPDEYNALNNTLASHDDTPVWEAIKQRFDTTPESVASWLMEFWQMPEGLFIAQREQRNPDYKRKYASQANLVLLANRLLYPYEFGDADTAELPAVVLENLGINENIAMACVEKVMENQADLSQIAEQLVA